MHSTARQFLANVRSKFPSHFANKEFDVLDVGSLAVNCDNAEFFSTADRVFGIDVMEGPGVDQVCPAHEFRGGPYRTVLCTSMLEHDANWRESMWNMVSLVEPGGLLVITCAGPGYLEHCSKNVPMQLADGRVLALDHYQNLDTHDLAPYVFNKFWPFWLNYLPANHDTFFWGIKK